MNSHDYVLKIAENQVPSMRYSYKENKYLWHKKAKDKLHDLLGIRNMIKCKEDKFRITKEESKDGLLYIYFSFESEPGYEVPGCLVKKSNLSEKAPLLLCLQGHSSGMHVSLGIKKYDTDVDIEKYGRDYAIRGAKEGMVSIVIEQRYMGSKGNVDNPYPSCNACREDSDANMAMATFLIGRTPIGERVWDAMSTIDVAENHFADLIDFNCVGCVGNSGGGTATYYTSALDERITFSVPSCSVCSFESSIMAMNHCPCNFVPGILNYFNMGDLGCLIAPRNLIVVCGDEDPIFPLSGVMESYEITKKFYEYLGIGERCNIVVGHGGHRFYPDDAWPVIHKITGR